MLGRRGERATRMANSEYCMDKGSSQWIALKTEKGGWVVSDYFVLVTLY